MVLTVLTGVLYPLAITLAAQVAFPHQANGSLVRDESGRVVGSELVGQSFSGKQYFWSRPSATSPTGYNGGASSGSNLGPLNPALLDAVKKRVKTLKKAHPDQSALAPVDLVTTSASGLDPHISPAAAEYQMSRVARARGKSLEELRTFVARHSEGRTLGILGEPRVNVLLLNLALDRDDRKNR
jgi:K+-transporting ATPase ATPase C chain